LILSRQILLYHNEKQDQLPITKFYTIRNLILNN